MGREEMFKYSMGYPWVPYLPSGISGYIGYLEYTRCLGLPETLGMAEISDNALTFKTRSGRVVGGYWLPVGP